MPTNTRFDAPLLTSVNATDGVIVRHITPPPDDWAAPLFNRWHEHGQLCVLLDRFRGDPSETDDAPGALGDTAGPHPKLLPLEHPGFAQAPEQAPALLMLEHGTPGHMAWLEWSVRAARQEWATRPWRPNVCAWLTPAPVPAHSLNPNLLPVVALQRHLSQRLHSIWNADTAHNTPHYLRYFDPRVLPRLLQVLAPESRAAFLSPVADWFQLDRDGTWLHLQSSPGLDARAVNLRFDAAQSQVLSRSQALSRTAQALADAGHVLPFADNSRIDAALEQGQTLGLTQNDDLVTFATNALLYGVAFSEHADLPTWCRAAQGGAALADAIADTPLGPHTRAAA
jgi:Domain of unknown function (DUF4123)